MADLPEDRVTHLKPPFTYTGVDCFGPFEVRCGRTKVKRYGVIFTCQALLAVHIEVAFSLDTESFINALRRFIARRGQPEEIRSDNGGNFMNREKQLLNGISRRYTTFSCNAISSGRLTHQPALTMVELGNDASQRFTK